MRDGHKIRAQRRVRGCVRAVEKRTALWLGTDSKTHCLSRS